MQQTAPVPPVQITIQQVIPKNNKISKLTRRLLGLMYVCVLLITTIATAANQDKQPTLSPVPNTVFLCKNAGQEIYTNTKLNKDCKGFVLGSLPSSTSKATVNVASPAIANPTPSATTFPKVSAITQNERDADRKRILSEEMLLEQKNVELAKKELAQQEAKALSEEKNYKKITERLQPFKDTVAQHERNIQALRKEMASVK